MVKPTSAAKSVHLSISAFAGAISSTRETVAKRIKAAGVTPVGTERGYPVYDLGDLIRATYLFTNGVQDPDKLDAFQKKAHWQAARAKLEYERDTRELIPVDEVARGYFLSFNLVVQILETMPDILERDCGLSNQAAAAVERRVDGLRWGLYQQLIRTDYCKDAAEVIRGPLVAD